MNLTNRILKAIAGQEQQTADELQEALGEKNRKRMLDNCTHLVNRGLITRQPHEITRLPAYCITAAGRERLATMPDEPETEAPGGKAAPLPIPVFGASRLEIQGENAAKPEEKPEVETFHVLTSGVLQECAGLDEAKEMAAAMVRKTGGRVSIVKVVARADMDVVWSEK